MGQVLIVDDDPIVLQIAKTILERSGLATLCASDGFEALTLLEAHDVDVLLTDLTMPGMSGGELIKEALKRRPGLPVCCMTARTPPLSPVLKHVRIIAKPFTPRGLILAVRQLRKARPHGRTGEALANLHKRAKAARAAWQRATSQLRDASTT